ncbi:MAG TPA: hypothetical protein VFA66_16200 [Gaiellaceae bacterium]|nr:hypothetical protein [Gaiellaceae bacterium]
MFRTVIVAVAALGLTLGTAAADGSRSAARTDPRGFTARVDNPWFPLKPGIRYAYTGIKDGKPSRDLVVVSRRTRRIRGAPCVIVQDRLWIEGKLEERTTDWYTQDRLGNVWYFGEQTAELDRNGRVTSTEGTWLAGVNGAQPGIYMPAHPRVGESGRQEYYKGHAEDHFRIRAVLATVPAGTPNSVVTEETTPLEPGVLDNKIYVRGIGVVTELTVKGGNERNQLISVTHA